MGSTADITDVGDGVDSNGLERLGLRVPPEVKRRAAVDAARHGVSLNQHVIDLLNLHLPSAEPPAEG